jgi:gliding motility-associated-like protein
MRYLLGFFYLILLSISLPVHASVFSSFEVEAILADAGQDQAICADFALIQGSDPGLSVGLWTVIEGSGTVDSPNSPSTQVSNLSPGLNRLVWEYYDGALLLESDTLEIIRFLPPNASAGLDFSACAGDLVSMSASTLLPLESGFWQSIGHLENVSSPLLSNSLLTISTPGSYAFEWSVSNLICPLVSDTVIVEIIAPPTAPEAGAEQTICVTSTALLANEPTLGETGTWSVIEGSGTFSDQNSASSSVSGLSTGNNILRWTISNANCATVSDDVLIIVETPPTSEAGSNQTICSSSATLNATGATGGNWSVVSGSGIFADASNASSEVTGLSLGNNVFRWTVSGGSCGDVSDEVTITVDENPTTALAGDDQSICSTSSTLAANTPIVGAGTWSLISGSGSISNLNDPNSAITGLSTGNNIFQWTISNGICPSSSDQVTISVDAAPITPDAGQDQTICTFNTVLSAFSATGGSWSVVSGTGSFANAALANTNVTGLSVGPNVFRWTIPGGACGSVSDDVTITVQAQPSTALAGNDQTICATVTTLEGNAATVGNGLWTVISGTGIFANANLANTSVSGLSTGTNTFRWTISNGVCTPSFDEVSIEVDANPITPNAGIDLTICNNSTTLAATAATGGSWSVLSGTGTFVNASFANTNVSGLSVGSNVFRWTIPGGACGSVSDDVTITVQAQPSAALAGNDQTICATVTTLEGNTPTVGNGVWTVISGTGTFANANLSSTSVSGLSTGNNVFRWTISNGVCPSSSDEVSVTVENQNISVFAGNDQNICTPLTNLNATAAPGGVWTVVSGSGIFANANLESTSVSGLSLGANVFRWTIDGGICLDVSDDITITVNQAPSSALAGQDQTVCATAATLNGNTPLLGSGVWTVVSGTAIFSNENQPNSSVSGLSVGQNVLRWSISNGVCTPSFDDVTITVQSAPTASNAGNDQSVCGNSTQLSANTPVTGTGTWSVVSGSGTFVNASNPQTQVTGLGSGINVFRWTVINGFCQPSIDEVSIQSFQNPTIAQAGPDVTICNSDQILSANTALIGIGTWSVVSGSANIQSPNNPSTTISGLSLGSVVLNWTISNGTCPPSSDNVVLQVLAAPSSDAGADQSVCITSATLNASAAGFGNTGVWALVSGSGIISNANNPNSTVSNLGLGANVFKWTVTNGACPAAVSQVAITRTAAPSQAIVGTDIQTCATSAVLSAVAPTVGTGFWSVLAGTGLIDNPSSASTAINGLTPGLNQLVWTVSSGTCLSTSDTLNIVVDQNPTSANAGSDQQVCSTVSNFQAIAPTVETGVWTVISGTGTIAQLNDASSQISNLSTGANVFRWTVTNGSCVTFDEVTITRFLVPTVASAGLDQTICASSVLLNGNNPSVGTGAWSIITGSGTIANSVSASTNVSNLAPGANVFRWTISNGACLASSDEVTIIRQIPPSPAVAGSDAEVCGSSINLSASAPISGNGIWSLISGSGTLANPQSTTTSVSDLGVGANVFQWTTLNGNCPTSTDQVTILRFESPSTADAGIDITICGDSVVLNADAPLVGIGLWTIIAGNGDIVSPNAPNSVVQNIPVGLLFLNWTISNGVCPVSSDQAIINAQVLSTLADAGPDQEICGNVAELNGSESGSANALWTFLNGSGAFDQPQFPSVLAFTSFNGSQLIEYSITNGACVSRDTVELTTWQALSPVFAGTDTSLCVDSYVLTGTADDFASLAWSTVSALIASPNSDTTAVSALFPGQNLITLTASNGTCPTQSDQVIVTYAAPSEPATVMEDANLCSDSLLISATPSGGEWSIVGPLGTIQNPSLSNTLISEVSLGTTEVVYTITIGDCVSSDTLQIVRSESPAFADAGPDQQICGQEAILAGNTPNVGVGTWIFIDNPADITNVNDPNASLTADFPGLRAMAWSITNNFCTVSDTVEMIFLDTPVSNGGPNVTACLNDTAYLQAALPVFGTSYWNLITSNATIVDSTNQNTALLPVETGNAYLWWTVSNGACRDSDLVVVTILGPDDPECLANEPAVFIPEGFSPNGDGKFDQFVITVPSPKAIRLQVFDRYGNLVYENQNYQNDWSGVANQGNVLSGRQLAEGTYYYLVNVEGESDARRGYFTLWR